MEDQNQHHILVSMLVIQSTAHSVYEGFSKVMIMLNHLVQVQAGSAGTQRDIIFITLTCHG